MKTKSYITLLAGCCFAFMTGGMLGGCDVAYTYDIESGTDDYNSDHSNVTVDTLASIDVSMYDKARIFPGLVDTATERRIDTTVAIDLGRKYVSAVDLRMNVVPREIYSTGLYAGAGELITIENEEQVLGLTVQIGSHMEDLSQNVTTNRQPIIFNRKTLFPGKNTIKNPMGGYIWILREGDVGRPGEIKLAFKGVYKAPDYDKEQTNALTWANEITHSTVPWLELRGKHVAFSVPRLRMEMKLQEDPTFAAKLEQVMETWDNYMVRNIYGYYGLEENAAEDKSRMPEFPERIVLDIQLKNNLYMYWSGQPIMTLYTSDMVDEITDLERLQTGNSAALCTALGNNYLSLLSPWWTEVEKAAAVIPLYRLAEESYLKNPTLQMGDIFTGEGEGINSLFPEALLYAQADSSKWLKKDKGTDHNAFTLLPIVQLAHYADQDPDKGPWAFYDWINKELRNAKFLSSYGKSFFFESLCKYYGENFAPFFERWGMDIPDKVRAEAEKYPLMKRTIWNYDPLAQQPDAEVTDFTVEKYPYRHDRSAWDIKTVDANYNENQEIQDKQTADKMIDGEKKTYWHASWRNGANPVSPHYIIIDMKQENTLNGIYWAHGERDYSARKLVIQMADTDTDVNDVFYDSRVEWKTIAIVRPFYDVKNYVQEDGVVPNEGMKFKTKSEHFFEFLTSHTCRYLRIALPEPNFAYANWDENGTFEIGGRPEPYHTVAEFGTFHF